MGIAEIAFHLAVGRRRIGHGAALNGADINVVFLREVRQFFDLDDLVSHFKDGAPAVFRIVAHMAAAAVHFHEEAPAALALYHETVVRKAGLEIEGAFGTDGFLPDHLRRIGEAVGRFFIGI